MLRNLPVSIVTTSIVTTSITAATIAAFAVVALPGRVLAQGAAPNLAGTYRCEPEPVKCQLPTYALSQTGNNLEIKGANNTIAAAKLTSNITISAGPTWNSIGRVLPDGSIEWTNGTRWTKQ